MMMRKCVIIGDRGEDCQIKSRLIQTFVTGKYHHGSYTVSSIHFFFIHFYEILFYFIFDILFYFLMLNKKFYFCLGHR